MLGILLMAGIQASLPVFPLGLNFEKGKMTLFLFILFEQKYIFVESCCVFVIADIFFYLERNKIRNMSSLLSWIFNFNGSKPFVTVLLLFFFLLQRHNYCKSQLYLEEWLVLKMTFGFLSFSLSFFNFILLLSLLLAYSYLALLICCSAFDVCNPEKDRSFCSFSKYCYGATAFHIIFVRLTHPKADMMRQQNFHRLVAGAARVTCDLKCSQRRKSSCVNV